MNHEISLDALQQKLNGSVSNGAVAQEEPDGFCLLDVREPWEASLAAIQGSRLIPMGQVPSRAHRELDPDAHIVVYCHHGARSLSVTMWLREQGFSRAQSLAGGIHAWSQKVDPSLPRY
ncbi:MAG: rhodanese-like domain-containing protein [Acidobacteriaceae bacterium]